MKSVNKKYNLFEYADPVEFVGSIDSLDTFLDEIWQKRDVVVYDFWNTDNHNVKTPQQFIQFIRKNNTFRSTKYVGVIQYNGQVINLLPKIFDNGNTAAYTKTEIENIQRHILWWLSYCGKYKFPKSRTQFNSVKTDFLEILIHLFANFTQDTLNKSIYQGYQEIENNIPYMKGRLNVNKYVNNNLVNGNLHKLCCTYDSFEIDNLFNRIIKYVTKLLLVYTSSKDNKKLLQNILFLLEEVSDIKVTIHDCHKVRLNSLFKENYTILDYCKLFLSNSTVLSYKDELDVFAFLIPMEYVFEDFIYGFIKKELTDIKIKAQQGTTKLTTDGAFQLRPDLVIYLNDKNIIADTKYKKIYPTLSNDKKKGISESDMYQMLAYAVRNKVDEIKLLYPSTVLDSDEEETINFNIIDEFATETRVKIHAHKLPIIADHWQELDTKKNIDDLFIDTTEKLKTKLLAIFS